MFPQRPGARPARYHKISRDVEVIPALFTTDFLQAHEAPPERMIVNLDATDDPLHGHHEGRFFRGYYGCYRYLPLYIFCSQHLLCAKLRRSNIDAAHGSKEEVACIVAAVRARWTDVEI